MDKFLRLGPLFSVLLAGLWGCGDKHDDGTITAPEGFDVEEGLTYPIEVISFSSIDSVQVSSIFGRPQQQIESARPVVILVHDFTLNNQEWFTDPIFVELLKRDYLTLAIDLRGHGGTPLPDDRQLYELTDLDNSYLDVQAALIWLRDQPAADNSRIAVVGTGVGGNIAYISMGAFPAQIKTAVALSAGLWDGDLQPIVTGAGLETFAPHSMLFMVGENDIIVLEDTSELHYAAFAATLAETTGEPKNVIVSEDSDAHGLGLLGDLQTANSFFSWLEDHL